MRIHCLQHVPFETPAAIATWADERKILLELHPLYGGSPVPNLGSSSLIVVLGGSMGVYDEAQFPFLTEEKRFLREAIERRIPVLGICLGAQLLAEVLGAKVYPAEYKEIGWFDVERDEALAESGSWINSCLPSTPFSVFHWHGDTYDLPAGATRILTRRPGCREQGFVAGEWEQIVALQCHLEMNGEAIKRMLEHGHPELESGAFVMSAAEMRVRAMERCAANEVILRKILDRLITLGS